MVTEAERKAALAQVPEWRLSADGSSIGRSIVFPDFVAAFAFMTDVAAVAQAMDHHPEWTNVYNRVTIRLTTHDADGLTNKDFTLAGAIDKLLNGQA